MGNRRAVFNRLDVQASRLQRSDRTFTTAARTFDADVDFLHPEFDCLFRSLLSRHLARKGSAFATALKVAGPSAGPTQCFTLSVRNGDRCIVERRIDVRHSMSDIATDSFLFRFSQFLKTPHEWFACRSSADL